MFCPRFYSVSCYGLIPIAVSGREDAAAGGVRVKAVSHAATGAKEIGAIARVAMRFFEGSFT